MVVKEIFQLPNDEKLYAIAYFSDNSHLFIRERYHKRTLIKYSYHFIHESEVHRWDNVPHHPYIATFPYHYHLNEVMYNSVPMNMDAVLKRISAIKNQ